MRRNRKIIKRRNRRRLRQVLWKRLQKKTRTRPSKILTEPNVKMRFLGLQTKVISLCTRMQSRRKGK